MTPFARMAYKTARLTGRAPAFLMALIDRLRHHFIGIAKKEQGQ